MKTNEMIAHIEARIEANAKLESEAQKRLNDAQSADEVLECKKLVSKYATKQKYLAMLVKSEETIASVCDARVSAEQLETIESDSYMLAKLAYLAQALKFKRKVSFSDDDALAQALEYIAESNFQSIDADTLRKRLKTKKSDYTIAHATNRQAYMILNLLARLNAAEKKDKAFSFDSKNALIKKIASAYAKA